MKGHHIMVLHAFIKKSTKTGLDRRCDQSTLYSSSAESRIGASTGFRDQVSGRSGRNGGQGRKTQPIN